MNLLKTSILVFLVGISLFSTVNAATLSDAQRAQIDRYLSVHNLNPYGDAKGTCYPGGTPLFDMHTGRMTDRYEYVLRKFPTILQGFVAPLPFDGVAGAADEVANEQMVEQVRKSVEAHDFKAIRDLLAKMTAMPIDQLKAFGPVLKDTRRMLNGTFIDEISVTTQIHELLKQLAAVEARLVA